MENMSPAHPKVALYAPADRLHAATAARKRDKERAAAARKRGEDWPRRPHGQATPQAAA